MIDDTGWTVRRTTADDFLLWMTQLGEVLELSLVGAFDPSGETPGRASRRDVDLPWHKDGVRAEELARLQGGLYVERPGIDYVGLYCLRGGDEPCHTTLSLDGESQLASVPLTAGQALVFDNVRLYHGRRGPVGRRLVLRAWVRKMTQGDVT